MQELLGSLASARAMISSWDCVSYPTWKNVPFSDFLITLCEGKVSLERCGHMGWFLCFRALIQCERSAAISKIHETRLVFIPTDNSFFKDMAILQ